MKKGKRPWWVLGAEVHQMLDQLGILLRLAHVRINSMDNDDGFCAREQIWLDGNNMGLNQDLGRKLRKAARALTK